MNLRYRKLTLAVFVLSCMIACAPAGSRSADTNSSNVPPAPSGRAPGGTASASAPAPSPQQAAPPPTYSGGEPAQPAPSSAASPGPVSSAAAGPRVCTVYRNPALGNEEAPGSLVQIVSPDNRNQLAIHVIGAPDQQAARIRQLHADAGSSTMPMDFTAVGSTFSESAERAEQLCERWKSGAAQ